MWVMNIKDWARESGLRVEDFGITERELDRLSGEDPNQLPNRRLLNSLH